MTVKKLVLGDLSTNCYIIWQDDSDTCAVIDPAAHAETILSEAKKYGKTIDSILLTHCHFDHIGALEELVYQTGAAVYAGAREVDGLSDPYTNLSFHMGHLISFCGKVNKLYDGSILIAGGVPMRVIETPGHTVGSVTFVADHAKTIFSGDTVFRGNIGRYDFPGGDYKTIIDSLLRVLACPEDYSILSGHGNDTTVAHEKNNNRFYNS